LALEDLLHVSSDPSFSAPDEEDLLCSHDCGLWRMEGVYC
jgi:hypothetical protein